MALGEKPLQRMFWIPEVGNQETWPSSQFYPSLPSWVLLSHVSGPQFLYP